MRQGDAGCRRRAVRRADAGDDFDPNARSLRGLHLLTPAPEDEGIAALEAHDIAALAGFAYEQGVDIVLGKRVMRAPFGDRDQPRIGPRERQDRCVHQTVMHDQVGAFDQARGAQRQQVGIAGACAHEMDCSGFYHAGKMRVAGRGRQSEWMRRRTAKLLKSALHRGVASLSAAWRPRYPLSRGRFRRPCAPPAHRQAVRTACCRAG